MEVTVQDASGNTVTSATNAISLNLANDPTAGAVTLSGAGPVNAVNGVATFSVRLDVAETGYTLAAGASGLNPDTSVAFDISAAAAAQLAFTVQPSDAPAGVGISPAVEVTVQDAFGNTVQGAADPITLAMVAATDPSSGAATLSGNGPVNAVNGVATFANVSIDFAATGYTLQASASGLTPDTSAAFDVAPAGATQLLFTVQPSDADPGVTITPAITVAIQDGLGNTVTTATETITLSIVAATDPSGGTATLSGGGPVSAVNGVATFPNVSIDIAGAGYTLETSASGVMPDTSATFNIEAPGVPTLQVIASGLNSPLYLTAPPDDTTRLFIVERGGTIRVLRNDTLLNAPFLDIQPLVLSGGERGLLSMAFHPAYATNGQFFVSYTGLDGSTNVVRYLTSANPDLADELSASQIFNTAQPFSDHNGGLVTFGPDGMLYIGLGDGGSVGDALGNGQDSTTVLGSLLRIDVDGGSPYAIPTDNPFKGHPTAAQEIWAYGLRNPWRYSFDRLTGDLYIADVGRSAREEVDFQLASSAGGENYGWNTMEGTLCFSPSSGCDTTGLVLPVLEYAHSQGCSITGGYVYRGTQLSGLTGHYFYSDFCSGWVRSFRMENGVAVDERDYTALFGTINSVASFGEDARGELYIVSLGGTVYRMVP